MISSLIIPTQNKLKLFKQCQIICAYSKPVQLQKKSHKDIDKLNLRGFFCNFSISPGNDTMPQTYVFPLSQE